MSDTQGEAPDPPWEHPYYYSAEWKEEVDKMNLESQEPGRRIPLDSNIYCPTSGVRRGGSATCDHDFDPIPTRESDYGATWTCTRCKMEVSYDVWD